MNSSQTRRTFSLLAVILPFFTGTALAADKTLPAKIERDFHGRIGVFALDIGSGKQWGYRASERFAFCSTFKMVAAGGHPCQKRTSTRPTSKTRQVRPQ